MIIVIKLTQSELDEMNFKDADEMRGRLYEHLDEASLPNGKYLDRYLDLVGYDIQIDLVQ